MVSASPAQPGSTFPLKCLNLSVTIRMHCVNNQGCKGGSQAQQLVSVLSQLHQAVLCPTCATAHVLHTHTHISCTHSKYVFQNRWTAHVMCLNMYNLHLPIDVLPFATKSSCVGQTLTHSSPTSTIKNRLEVGIITLAQFTTLKVIIKRFTNKNKKMRLMVNSISFKC